MPDPSLSREERTADLNRQFDAFMRSDALKSICSLLGCGPGSLGASFSTRRTADGRVIEEQAMKSRSDLEGLRHELYPLFRELGALDINEPLSGGCSRVIVLGGSLNACNIRARRATSFVDGNTLSVDGIACYRPVSPAERSSSMFTSSCETEFGVMAEAMVAAFGLDPLEYEDNFEGDRNLNSVSCVRIFRDAPRGCMYRVFAAPSTEPQSRRADTFDSLDYYLKKQPLSAADRLLFITGNRYCNRQFIQLASKMLSSGSPAGFDIIGCMSSREIPSSDQYDPTFFVNDLVATIDWINRFRSASVSSR